MLRAAVDVKPEAKAWSEEPNEPEPNEPEQAAINVARLIDSGLTTSDRPNRPAELVGVSATDRDWLVSQIEEARSVADATEVSAAQAELIVRETWEHAYDRGGESGYETGLSDCADEVAAVADKIKHWIKKVQERQKAAGRKKP